MLVTVFSGFLLSAFLPWLVKPHQGRFWGIVLALLPLGCFIYFATCLPPIIDGRKFFQYVAWLPELGINLSFGLDGLSVLFALLITGVGTLIVIYSGAYLNGNPELNRFFVYLFIFMSSMLGLVLSSNLIGLLVFWELTSLSSYLLIGFRHQSKNARMAAMKGLFINVMGGLCLLAAFVLIDIEAGTFELEVLLSQPDILGEGTSYFWILGLIFMGAFTKSAQFPFHIWLPKAMEAPAPVSAYLHSATMVKGGIYLLARLHPLLSDTAAWFVTLSSVGGVTMLMGAMQAIKQTDMKALLAYTTIMALGSMVFLLASSQINSIKAVIVFLLTHAMYKASLFMAVGDIQKRTGTHSLRVLHGLARYMPVTFGIVVIAAISMSGLPPLLGYYVKELVYEANLAAPVASHVLSAVVVLSNMMIVMLALLIVIKPFFGKKPEGEIHEADPQMWVGGIVLSCITIFLSAVPMTLYQFIIVPAVSVIIPVHLLEAPAEMELWHGLTPSFGLSVMTLTGGVLLYFARNKIRQMATAIHAVFSYGPDYFYHRFMNGIASFADWQTRLIQCGLLRVYLLIIFTTLVFVLIAAMRFESFFGVEILFPKFTPLSIFLALTLLSSAFATSLVRSYFTGLIFLGLFGMVMALVFLVNGAPDVAMTQVLTETLIVIVVVLNFYREKTLPKFEKDPPLSRVLNFIVAVTLGLILTICMLNIVKEPFDLFNSDYFIRNSVLLGHGRNIVNVILVDFRALDTMGEILVVAISAMGIVHLLRKKKSKGAL